MANGHGCIGGMAMNQQCSHSSATLVDQCNGKCWSTLNILEIFELAVATRPQNMHHCGSSLTAWLKIDNRWTHQTIRRWNASDQVTQIQKPKKRGRLGMISHPISSNFNMTSLWNHYTLTQTPCHFPAMFVDPVPSICTLESVVLPHPQRLALPPGMVFVGRKPFYVLLVAMCCY